VLVDDIVSIRRIVAAPAHGPGTEGAVGPGLWVRNKEQWADREGTDRYFMSV
jgi:hypothetical protein